MARIYTESFENADTTTTGGRNTWDTWVSAVIGSTHARTGTKGMQITGLTSGTAQGAAKKWLATAANGPYFLRKYIYVVTPPSANNTIIAFTGSASLGNQIRCSIALASDGTLKLFSGTSAGTQIGSASAAINDGNQHMVELKTDTTAASGSRVIEARLDGTVFATTSTGTQSTSLAFSIGGNLGLEAQTTGEWWFDDVALNDTTVPSQTSYPGSAKVIAQRPNGTGDSNAFSTQTGGTAGSANNYTRVNETTPDDATSFNGDDVIGHEDFFTMNASGIGASDTVNAVQLHARFRNNTANAFVAITFEIKKASGGTIAQSAAIVPDTTTWNTDGTAVPRLPIMTLYADPDGNPWTQATLDSMQAGYKITTGSNNRIDVSALWVTVDYTPGTGGGTNSNFFAFM